MHPNDAYESSCFADQRAVHEGLPPYGLPPRGATFQLTRRVSMIVALTLSLGLWAAIWAALASLASAAFG
jgi:hypothetical protein